MKTLSETFKARTQQQHGSEPLEVLEIVWKTGSEYYADKAVGVCKGAIVELSTINSTVTVEDTSEISSISVTLDDTDGTLKEHVDKEMLEGATCILYQWYSDLEWSDKVQLFKGLMASEIIWDEGERTLSFSIESKINEAEAGYILKEGDIPNLDEGAWETQLPLVFGTVNKVPGVRVRKRVTTTLASDQDFQLGRNAAGQMYERDAGYIQDSVVNISDNYFDVADVKGFPRNKNIRLLVGDPESDNYVIFSGQFNDSSVESRFHYVTYVEVVNSANGSVTLQPTNEGLYAHWVRKNVPINTDSVFIKSRNPGSVYENDGTVIWINSDMQLLNRYCLFLQSGNTQGYAFRCIEQDGNRCKFDTDLSILSGSPLDHTHGWVITEVCCYISSRWAGAKTGYGLNMSTIDPAKINELGYLTNEHTLNLLADTWSFPIGTMVSEVDEYNDLYIFSANPADIVSEGMQKAVYGLKRSINNKYADLIESGYYIAYKQDLARAEWDVPAVEFPKPPEMISTYDGSYSYTGDIYADIESKIRLTDGTLCGSNTAYQIWWLLNTYLPEITVDATSFRAVAAKIDDVPSDFIVASGIDTLELCHQMAWEARCKLLVRDGVATLIYLPGVHGNVANFTEFDIIDKSFQMTYTSIEDLITLLTVTYVTKYTDEWDAEQKIIRKGNITRFGTREDEWEILIYTKKASVERCIDYWFNLYSNSWRVVNLKTVMTALPIQVHDYVGVKNHLLGDVTYQGYIQSIEHDTAEKTFQISIRLDTKSADPIIDDDDPPVNPPNTYLTVISPNGGESLTAGSAHTILWHHYLLDNKRINVYLYLEGRRISTLATNLFNSGSYSWAIDSSLPSSDKYKIYIETLDRNHADYSNNYFTILSTHTNPNNPILTLMAPNGGQTFKLGEEIIISWTSANITQKVQVEMYKADQPLAVIANDIENNATIAYKIPLSFVPGTDYKVRVTTMDGTLTDESDDYITITDDEEPLPIDDGLKRSFASLFIEAYDHLPDADEIPTFLDDYHTLHDHINQQPIKNMFKYFDSVTAMHTEDMVILGTEIYTNPHLYKHKTQEVFVDAVGNLWGTPFYSEGYILKTWNNTLLKYDETNVEEARWWRKIYIPDEMAGQIPENDWNLYYFQYTDPQAAKPYREGVCRYAYALPVEGTESLTWVLPNAGWDGTDYQVDNEGIIAYDSQLQVPDPEKSRSPRNFYDEVGTAKLLGYNWAQYVEEEGVETLNWSTYIRGGDFNYSRLSRMGIYIKKSEKIEGTLYLKFKTNLWAAGWGPRILRSTTLPETWGEVLTYEDTGVTPLSQTGQQSFDITDLLPESGQVFFWIVLEAEARYDKGEIGGLENAQTLVWDIELWIDDQKIGIGDSDVDDEPEPGDPPIINADEINIKNQTSITLPLYCPVELMDAERRYDPQLNMYYYNVTLPTRDNQDPRIILFVTQRSVAPLQYGLAKNPSMVDTEALIKPQNKSYLTPNQTTLGTVLRQQYLDVGKGFRLTDLRINEENVVEVKVDPTGKFTPPTWGNTDGKLVPYPLGVDCIYQAPRDSKYDIPTRSPLYIENLAPKDTVWNDDIYPMLHFSEPRAFSSPKTDPRHILFTDNESLRTGPNVAKVYSCGFKSDGQSLKVMTPYTAQQKKSMGKIANGVQQPLAIGDKVGAVLRYEGSRSERLVPYIAVGEGFLVVDPMMDTDYIIEIEPDDTYALKYIQLFAFRQVSEDGHIAINAKLYNGHGGYVAKENYPDVTGIKIQLNVTYKPDSGVKYEQVKHVSSSIDLDGIENETVVVELSKLLDAKNPSEVTTYNDTDAEYLIIDTEQLPDEVCILKITATLLGPQTFGMLAIPDLLYNNQDVIIDGSDPANVLRPEELVALDLETIIVGNRHDEVVMGMPWASSSYYETLPGGEVREVETEYYWRKVWYQVDSDGSLGFMYQYYSNGWSDLTTSLYPKEEAPNMFFDDVKQLGQNGYGIQDWMIELAQDEVYG